MIETPKCPYCGAEMMDDSYTWTCPKCYSNSPVVIWDEEKIKGMTEEEKMAYAREAALHRAEPDTTICQQLSKALRGNGNAALDELLEAEEQLKHLAEPEMRPLTLDEVRNRCKRSLEAEPLFLEFKRGWKSYRFWPRKPTPEQMAAAEWEEVE